LSAKLKDTRAWQAKPDITKTNISFIDGLLGRTKSRFLFKNSILTLRIQAKAEGERGLIMSLVMLSNLVNNLQVMADMMPSN
jgi:hypothetical protein